MLSEDVQWELSSSHISSVSGTNHIYYYQTVNGYQILNTLSCTHLLSNGKVIKHNTNFIKNSSDKIKGNSTPSLSAIDVIELIAPQLEYVITTPLKTINKEIGINQKTLISNGGFSKYDIPAKLVYLKDDNDNLILSWGVSILENDLNHWWDVYVNAITGKIIRKNDKVFTCAIENNNINSTENDCSNSNLNFNNNINNLNCEDCYEVIPMPLESPYYGERIIISNPINYIASPLGWHDDGLLPDDEFLVTKGNNVNSYIGTYQPNGGIDLDFTDYLFNEDFNIDSRYEDASITNLFYWNNIIHDVLYLYGFDEISGNFQLNNFDKGGAENDFVYVSGQENLNLCNAQIAISTDGVSPFITLNACGNKDGAFDNIVLIHEYTHGLSFRLTGGANSSNCLGFKGELLTEGWADWYALMMTMSPNDIGTKPRGIATYLKNQGENGDGIRAYPYTTDMSINPQTYDYIITHPGSHDVGSVWAAVLWELTWGLIEEYGFDENIYNFSGNLDQDAGNIIALAIATESMKLLPCWPGFVDGRDAIINAYHSIYGSENDCIIWDAFAKRGLGVNAFQGSPISVEDGLESFDIPFKIANFDRIYNNICLNSNVITGLGGGLPQGGIYSGNGVSDDGDGLTFTFNPNIAGVGIHTVTYEIFESRCTEASFDEGAIEVIIDEIFPEIICIEDIVVTISSNEDQYIIPDYTNNILTNDNCFSNPVISQSPIAGENVGIGNSEITMTSTDLVGNESFCIFILTVERDGNGQKFVIVFYPNPTEDEVIINSNRDIELLTLTIYDINGRLIQTKEFNDFGFERSVNFGNFSQGMYFLKIVSDEFSIIKRILKE